MNNQKNTPKTEKYASLPDYFKIILWSYNFQSINAERDKKIIILNTINYGDLKHWRWIKKRYGQREIQRVLAGVSVSELRPRVFKLASIIFSLKNLNYAPRGAK